MNLANAEEYGISIVKPDGKEMWLQGRFTLQEQLVKPEQPLNFKKRFFMDDFNVDKGDPTQLNFVYTQSLGRVRVSWLCLCRFVSCVFVCVSSPARRTARTRANPRRP